MCVCVSQCESCVCECYFEYGYGGESVLVCVGIRDFVLLSV